MGSTTDVAGVIILDQCLVTENSTTTNYGGAVQLSSTESGMSYMNKAFIINTTITENYCGEKGGGAVSVSAGQAFLLISSTIANNPSVDLSQGSNIRLDTKTGAHFYLVNSICVDKDANKNAVCIGANKGNVVSGGGNFVGGYLTTSSAASWLDTDESDKSYTAVFGTNELADNGGFTQTILPVVAGKLDGSEIAIIGNRWLALNDIEADITQDQRGYIRSEGTYALGAYDPASVSGLKKLENSNKIHVFPTITTNVVSVSDAVGKTVRLINMQGAILKTIVCQSDLEVIDMSEFTKGIYLLNIDSEAVKVVLQ